MKRAGQVSGRRKIPDARKQPIEMKRNPEMHPPFPTLLGGKSGSARKPASFDGAVESEGFAEDRDTGSAEMGNQDLIARDVIDWICEVETPLTKKSRLLLNEKLIPLRPKALEFVEAALYGRKKPHLVPYIVSALSSQERLDAAHCASVRLLEQSPGEAYAHLAYADICFKLQDYGTAAIHFRAADRIAGLAGAPAARAARAFGRIRDYAAQLTFLEKSFSNETPSVQRLAEVAFAASRSGVPDKALAYAREAVKAADELPAWPQMNLGITLAANGAFLEGCRQMGRALEAMDPAYADLLARSKPVRPARANLPERSSSDRPNGIAQTSAGDRPIVFYVPPKIGVGSSVLATLPFHHDCLKTSRPASLVVEQRLHSVFRRMLGKRVELLSPEARIDAPDAEVLNLFDLLADLKADEVREAGRRPLWTPDPDRVHKLKERYAAKYGPRKRVGIAWSTTNERTGFGRNIDLPLLGDFVKSNPDIQFISLQSSNEIAMRDCAHIDADNIEVDVDIDPLTSIEDQLAQIYVIGEVISIDCSAAHFSGALDVPTKCLLTGEPTWQWPERRSFYRSVSIVSDLRSMETG